MSNGNVSVIQTPVEITKESVVSNIIETTENNGAICQPGDKECVKRMIQAFSDCE